MLSVLNPGADEHLPNPVHTGRVGAAPPSAFHVHRHRGQGPAGLTGRAPMTMAVYGRA